MGKIELECVICTKLFFEQECHIRRGGGRGKYCSRACANIGKKSFRHTPEQLSKLRAWTSTHKPTTAWEKGHTPWNKHKRIFQTKGNRNGMWKGNQVSYSALHHWIKRELGQPTKCEHCGKDGFNTRQIEWANKSRQYKRDLDDWLRLCKSCHKFYDMKR